MTAVIPSFEEYEHARYILDHHDDFDYADVRAAVEWVAEFEAGIR